jgi:hypothetical protein
MLNFDRLIILHNCQNTYAVNPHSSGVINGGRSSGLVEQNVALKGKKIRTQINGKFNDISSADKVNIKI